MTVDRRQQAQEVYSISLHSRDVRFRPPGDGVTMRVLFIYLFFDLCNDPFLDFSLRVFEYCPYASVYRSSSL